VRLEDGIYHLFLKNTKNHALDTYNITGIIGGVKIND
jgi:hypothetical protein